MLSSWNKGLALALMLLPFSLQAQAPRSEEGSWQHADGLWWGWQRSPPDAAAFTPYLVDDGNVQLTRSEQGQNNLARLNWTLGIGERLDRFLQAQGQTIWERSIGKQRFSLGLDAGGSAYFGSTRYANLEDQFLLSNGLTLTEAEGATQRWGTGVTLADSISITRTLDLTLDANHQETQTKIAGQEQSASTINSWGARFEQRWVIARLQGSVRKTELELGNDLADQNLRTQQDVTDIQTRFLFPIAGRLNGSVGWQDLSSTGSDAADRRLSGPELGLAYAPQSAWSTTIFARALREKGNDATQGQIFGEANLAFRSDARNNFLMSVSKQIDLVTAYRVFTVQNFVATDQQRNTVTNQLQWAHQRGRYQLVSSIVRSRQEFAASVAHFTELTVTQTYDVTRRGQLSLLIGGRDSRFEAETPSVAIQRTFADARLGWQELLTGGLRPLGGRTFYRIDASYENLREEITDLKAERMTLLFSFGQLGNF